MDISVEKKFHLTGHSGSIYSLAMGDTDNSFFSAGSEGIVVRWDLNNINQPVASARVEGQVFSLLYIKDKNHLVIGTMGSSMHVIDLSAKKEIHHLAYHEESIFDIQQMPSGDLLVCSKEGVLTQWDANYALIKAVKVSEAALRQLTFHPQSYELAIGSSDNRIYILDAGSLSVKQVLEGPGNSVFSVCYSPDGKYLLTGSRDARLYIWDVKNKYTFVSQMPAHLFTINHIVYICGGRLLATAGRDKAVKIWDAETFELKKVLEKGNYNGHVNSVNKLLWHEQSNTLFSASDDRSIIGWNIQLN